MHKFNAFTQRNIIKRTGQVLLLLGLFLFLSTNSVVKGQDAIHFSALETVNLATAIYLPIVHNAGSALQSSYVLLGWNDLGMHCYNRYFQDLAVLPPYNNLWAQVILRGDPPQVVTQGIRVQYKFPNNTISSTKTDFWTYASQLFGVNLPDNVGLKGKGLADVMDLQADYFVAEGIPLTEFTDGDPTNPYPYQLADLTAIDINSNQILATLTVVAPVSTEMHCDTCHATGQDPGGNQPRTELNILAYHDGEENTNLFNSRPVLCARCHSSNALGLPGVPGLPSLSNAMHNQHSGVIPDTMDGCYSCHPGPSTKCLRDAMSLNVTSPIDPTRKMNCIDCHGGMAQVAQNPDPWLNEPRCDNCHTPTDTQEFNQDQPLYRHSKGHGGVYCEACHDSTHAIATSRESNDAIKFTQLQGHTGTLSECTVCHLTQPVGPGPHTK
jgi:hypothetical protein